MILEILEFIVDERYYFITVRVSEKVSAVGYKLTGSDAKYRSLYKNIISNTTAM